jgi:hypothetical protein
LLLYGTTVIWDIETDNLFQSTLDSTERIKNVKLLVGLDAKTNMVLSLSLSKRLVTARNILTF